MVSIFFPLTKMAGRENFRAEPSRNWIQTFQIHPNLVILWTTKMTHTVLMPRDSKIFESGPSSPFEAPRPQARASGQCNIICIVPLGPTYEAGLAGHFPVTDFGMLPIT